MNAGFPTVAASSVSRLLPGRSSCSCALHPFYGFVEVLAGKRECVGVRCFESHGWLVYWIMALYQEFYRGEPLALSHPKSLVDQRV